MVGTVILCALLLCLFPGTAQAYIDPGSGSLLIQLLLACVFGLIFAVRSYLAKIKEFFKKWFK